MTQPSPDAPVPLTAPRPTPARLSPHDVINLWRNLPSAPWGTQAFDDKLLRFANALSDHYLGISSPKQEGPRSPLSELELPTQQYNCLRRAGYDYVDQLLGLCDAQLLTVRGLGVTGVGMVRDALLSFEATQQRDGAT